MSITILCAATDPGARDISVHWQQEPGRLFVRTFAEGRVVATRERNMSDDSDFFATYEDDAGAFVEVEYASTRGWTYPAGAVVDATPEVLARWHAELARRAEAQRVAREARLALQVAPGKQVEFLGTGTKHGYRAGDVGECLQVETSRFRTYYRNGYNRPEANQRAQVRLADGRTVWVNADRLRVATEDRARLEELARGDVSDLLASRGVLS